MRPLLAKILDAQIFDQLWSVKYFAWVRSFSKIHYVKFTEDKALVFVILFEKCENGATLSLTVILTLISIAD